MSLDFKLAGYFRLQIYNPETGVTRDTGLIPNLITNGGLDAIGLNTNNTNLIQSIAVGSSGTAPAFTDTNMGAQVVRANCSGSPTGTWNATGQYTSGTWSVTYAQGAAAGNLAEVGTFTTQGSSGGTMFSHALLLDADGNPTVITVLPIEILTVTWELRIYQSMSDVTGTVTLNGTNYTYTIRPSWKSAGTAGVNPGFATSTGFTGEPPYCMSGVIGTTNGGPAGSTVGTAWSMSYGNYSVGTYTRDIMLSAGLTQCNGTWQSIGGPGSRYYLQTGLVNFQIGFSPAVTKDNTMTAAFTFRQSWGRYSP